MTPNPPPQWLPGRILQTAREKAGYSKRQAAQRANISPTHYRQLEDGGRILDGDFQPVNPSIDTLTKAATAVGADPLAVTSAAGINPADVQRKTLHNMVEGIPEPLLPAAIALLEGLEN